MKAKFSKTICLMLALVMVLAVGGISVSAATDLVPTMTFDSSVGGFSGQGKHTTETMQVVDDPAGSSNTVLEYYATTDGSAKKRTGINYKFSQTQSNTVIEQQFDYYTGKLNDTSTAGRLFIYADSDSKDVQLFQLYQNKGSALIQYTYADSFDSLDKNSWYTFKIVIDTIENEKYLFYKKTTDATWTDMTAAIDLCTTEITSLDGIFIGNTSLNTLKFYIDNFSVKVITQDELIDTLMGIYGTDASYITVPSKTLTQTSQSNGTKITYATGETSGIAEINFKYQIPEFASGQTRICFTENSAGADYSYGRRDLFDINYDGNMRARVGSGGTANWMYAAADVLAVGETYDFKLVAYLDTATYEVYYKKASESAYKSFAETLKLGGIDTTDNFGTYYSDDLEKLNSITKLEILAPADASSCVSDVTVTCYATPATVIAGNNEFLFKAYHDTLRNAGIVKDTFNPITDAANLTAITTNGIAGSQNVLLASTCPAIYAANAINYSAAKESANADVITAATTEATALVSGNVLANANKYVRKALLLNGLKSENAAMNLYFADASMRETTSIANAKYAVVDGATENSAGTLFVVAYGEGNVMKGVSAYNTITAGAYLPIKYQLPSGTTSVKAFIWKDVDSTLVPLAAIALK